MTRPVDDGRLREALRAMGQVDPTDEQVAQVMRRARARQAGASRRIAIVVALVVVALAALTLPPGRSAVGSVVGGLQEFFQGGTTPGGGRLPIDVDVILDDVAPGTSRVLVSDGAVRLVGYRQTASGWPCFGLGTAASECAGGDRWATRTAGHAIVALGTAPTPGTGDVVMWGLAERGVAAVTLIDANGDPVRASVGTNAFLVVLRPGTVPRTLVARDSTGLLLERADVTSLRPRACVGGPCPSG